MKEQSQFQSYSNQTALSQLSILDVSYILIHSSQSTIILISNSTANQIGDEGQQLIIESLKLNQTLLELQLNYPIPELDSLLKRNHQVLINNRNSIIINSIVIARNEQSLWIFPFEIWLNIFKFIQFPSKKHGKCSSDQLLTLIFSQISTINQCIKEKKGFILVQSVKGFEFNIIEIKKRKATKLEESKNKKQRVT